MDALTELHGFRLPLSTLPSDSLPATYEPGYRRSPCLRLAAVIGLAIVVALGRDSAGLFFDHGLTDR
jgi:hypothetical protein